MATIEYKDIPGEDGFHFYHEAEDRLYQRIVAGISAPSERPGAIVVLAEESFWRPPFQVHWLAEDEASTLDKLIEAAIELKADYRITDFYGRTNNEDTRRFLELYNRDQREKRMPTMEILSAPYSDTGDIASHINLLRNALHPDKKTLHLAKSKILPGALQEIPIDKLATATDREYPAVAALGYGAAALIEWEYISSGKRPTSYTKNSDYDELNYGNRRGTYKTDYNDLDY